jgi:heat shock protein HtpX
MYSEIASNKRRTIVFVGVFFVIWVAIGAVIGLVVRAIYQPSATQGVAPVHPTTASWAPVVVGVVIGSLLAIAGTLYSLTAGARLVLRVSGAVPANPAQYLQLNNLVQTLAIGEGIPTPAVYVINDPSPNAFATGVSPAKAAITYTTGILAVMNREELEGVTSHEMSHIKNHDIRLLLVVATLIGFAALLASVLWRGAFWGSLAGGNGEGRNNGGGNNIGGNNSGSQFIVLVIAAAALLSVVGFVIGPLIRLALSRNRESLADVSGVELTRNPAGLLSALKKLQQNDIPFKSMNHATAAMCIDDPLQHHDKWYHHLYDTHPPIQDRIARLEELASGVKV